MRVKHNPILFTLALICGLGGLVTVDQRLSRNTALTSVKSINVLNNALVAEIDRRLNQVRDTLGMFDAAHAVTCGPADSLTRAEALLAVPQLKFVSVNAPDGTQSCSTLPIKVVASSEFAGAGLDLNPLEHIDVVAIGQDGRLALRLLHKAANSPSMLAAILPLTDISVWLSQVADHADRLGHVRLSIGSNALVEFNGDFSVETSKPVAVSHSPDADATEASTRDGDLLVTTQSPTYPLSITLRQPNPAANVLDLRRIIVDFSIVVALACLLFILFIRSSPQDFGAGRFDLAIRRSEFDIAYRPILDLHSGKLAGAAVEIRWRRNNGIILHSQEFMPALIRSGYEPHMMRYALAKCHDDLSTAYKLRPRLQLKISLDHSTLLRPGFLDQVRRGLAGSTLRPHQLVLAVPGLGNTENPDGLKTIMRDLQRIGVQLELCHSFGEMAFDGADLVAHSIGLDVRLVQALQPVSSAGAGHARAWIGNVVKSCAAQGVRVCAYRIPSYDALKQLKAIGVDEVEGTVFTHALPSGHFMALVARAGLESTDADGSADLNPRRKSASF